MMQSNVRNVVVGTAALALSGAFASGCNLDQSFAYPAPVEGVPGVVDLGTLIPVEAPDGLSSFEDAQAYYRESIIFGELGPTGSPEYGGVSFNFEGTGGDVCIFMDPETVSWNAFVSPTSTNFEFSHPDNLYDDGDLDIEGGLSVTYSGSPGDRIGTFEVLFEDDLGIDVPIDFSECFIQSPYVANAGSHSGRAVSEFCTLNTTIQNVSYTVLLEAFSLPQDDNRLGYGLLVVDGTCDEFLASFTIDEETVFRQECIIQGESIKPGSPQGEAAAAAGLPSPTWLGSEKPTWEGSEVVETAFCNQLGLLDICEAEVLDVAETAEPCSEFNDPQEEGSGQRCFCGDVLDMPTGGSF